MTYFAQTLPQNAVSQSPTILNPQTSGTSINQQLAPQESAATFSLGSGSGATTLLNTSSQAGVALPDTSPQTVAVNEIDTSPKQSSPPFVAIGLLVLAVVVVVFAIRKSTQK